MIKIKDKIIVKEASLEDTIKVFDTIKEFDRKEYGTKKYIENRFGNSTKLILAAYIDNEPVGYILAYDKENNGDSFYCWIAAVKENYRRRGVLTELMKHLKDFAQKNNYRSLTIKTNNSRRPMLNFLVKTNWNFVEVEYDENILRSEIHLTINLNDFILN